MSKVLQLDAMSTESLWILFDDVRKILTVKMVHQQRDIERRLRDLHRADMPVTVSPVEKQQVVVTARVRRPYP